MLIRDGAVAMVKKTGRGGGAIHGVITNGCTVGQGGQQCQHGERKAIKAHDIPRIIGE